MNQSQTEKTYRIVGLCYIVIGVIMLIYGIKQYVSSITYGHKKAFKSCDPKA